LRIRTGNIEGFGAVGEARNEAHRRRREAERISNRATRCVVCLSVDGTSGDSHDQDRRLCGAVASANRRTARTRMDADGESH
jgi:hypothetical protein